MKIKGYLKEEADRTLDTILKVIQIRIRSISTEASDETREKLLNLEQELANARRDLDVY